MQNKLYDCLFFMLFLSFEGIVLSMGNFVNLFFSQIKFLIMRSIFTLTAYLYANNLIFIVFQNVLKLSCSALILNMQKEIEYHLNAIQAKKSAYVL